MFPASSAPDRNTVQFNPKTFRLFQLDPDDKTIVRVNRHILWSVYGSNPILVVDLPDQRSSPALRYALLAIASHEQICSYSTNGTCFLDGCLTSELDDSTRQYARHSFRHAQEAINADACRDVLYVAYLMSLSHVFGDQLVNSCVGMGLGLRRLWNAPASALVITFDELAWMETLWASALRRLYFKLKGVSGFGASRRLEDKCEGVYKFLHRTRSVLKMATSGWPMSNEDAIYRRLHVLTIYFDFYSEYWLSQRNDEVEYRGKKRERFIETGLRQVLQQLISEIRQLPQVLNLIVRAASDTAGLTDQVYPESPHTFLNYPAIEHDGITAKILLLGLLYYSAVIFNLSMDNTASQDNKAAAVSSAISICRLFASVKFALPFQSYQKWLSGSCWFPPIDSEDITAKALLLAGVVLTDTYNARGI
jgi:hypothetical protein